MCEMDHSNDDTERLKNYLLGKTDKNWSEIVLIYEWPAGGDDTVFCQLVCVCVCVRVVHLPCHL